MSSIFLMRHGQTKWNVERKFQGSGDSPLTNEGQQQALLASKKMQKIGINALYSSPRKRAVETALPISKLLDLPIQIHAGLEEIALGKWEGKTYDEIKCLYPLEYDAFFHDPALFTGVDGGESLLQVRHRAVEALEQIAMKHSNENVLVVSHAITIRLLLTYYMKISIKELWKVADITQTSMSQIVFSGHERLVTMTGNADHLFG